MARKKRDLISAVFVPKHVYLPGTEVFRSVDPDVASTKLELEERGRADGASGIPGDLDRTLTVAESNIVTYFRAIWEETVRDAKTAYEGLSGRFASYTAETEIDSLLAEPRAAALRLKELGRTEADRLRYAYRDVSTARENLERFVERERLQHDVPHGQSNAQKSLLIGIAVLLEFVVNIGIFGAVDEQGLAGAAPKVLVIPILNIGGMFFLSFFLARRILMRSPGHKLIGVVGWAASGVWLIGLNLAVAHWRDASGAALTIDAGTEALQRLFSQPWRLNNITSWALFGIGSFAGLIAFYEGWNWHDPYPGYGARRRGLEDRISAFRALREKAMAALQDEADTSANHLESEQRRAERALADRPQVSATAASLAEDLQLYATHLERIAADLFARYREANIRARAGNKPASFDSTPDLGLTVPKLAPLKLDPQTRKVAGRLAEAIEQITAAHAEACANLPSLSELDGAQV